MKITKNFATAMFVLLCLLASAAEVTKESTTPRVKVDLEQTNKLEKTSAIVQDWTQHTYVIDVTKSSGDGSWAVGPSSEVKIVETLRGRSLTGSFTVVWSPLHVFTKVKNSDCYSPSVPYDAKRDCSAEAAWDEMREYIIRPPKAGDRVIANLSQRENLELFDMKTVIENTYQRLVNANTLIGQNGQTYTGDADSIKLFLTHAKFSEPFAMKHSGTLFLALLVGVCVAIGLRFIRPSICASTCLACYGIYALYESGISATSNIRVDMLFVLPLLIGNTIVLASCLNPLLKKMQEQETKP